MSALVNIQIDRKLFEKLQRLAVPLVDDTSMVIERLIDHWDKTAGQDTEVRLRSKSEVESEVWRSSRGDIVLPVGTELQAEYKQRKYQARVVINGIEFNGTIYENLSPAAEAVKRSTGFQGNPSTNGQKFWKIYDKKTLKWVSVGDLYQSKGIDIAKLMDELDAL